MNEMTRQDTGAMMIALGAEAKAAAAALRLATTEMKDRALRTMAKAIRARSDEILAANARDLAEANDLTPALRDRLLLTPERIEGIASGIEAIADLPDPVGRTLEEWTRPNGLKIARVSVPIGIIGLIYESRPNVTADAGALCLKSGNVAILRGGSESFHSSRAIHDCLIEGLIAANLPPAAITRVPTPDRAAVGMMLAGLGGVIDLIVPRGGKSLVARVQADARVPVLAHLEGLCHVYVDRDADLQKAIAIVLNSKLRRTGVCGAAETLLIDRTVAESHGAPILRALSEAGCEIRGDVEVRRLLSAAVPASEADWTTEYLDRIIAAKIVGGVKEAIAHIAAYGSNHTDAIVTESPITAETFLREVDSAIALWNASTQFADGGEFGFGAEIGIATGKLHARGPVGLAQLTSYKYVVRGTGQIRP